MILTPSILNFPQILWVDPLELPAIVIVPELSLFHFTVSIEDDNVANNMFEKKELREFVLFEFSALFEYSNKSNNVSICFY